MGQITLPGNPPITIRLRRSSRARRLSLRMSRLDGTVTMTLPKRLPEAEAVAFAHEKETWLRGHLDSQTDVVTVGYGTSLPFAGQMRDVVPTTARRLRVTDTTLEVPGPAEQVPARLRAWLREQARDRLTEASDQYAARLGKPYARITLRDTRSRWGSCTVEGRLMYSWRLILAPTDVLDYVAAHEVAHLAEMNHAPAFWETVTRIHGPWQAQRRWLRTHGAALHAFRFGD